MKEKLKRAIQFIANPRLLLCLLIAWMITNGWSYIMLGIGSYYHIQWMITVSSAYLAFLWLPISPEKVVTLIIAIILLRFIFPKDQKTLAILIHLYDKAKAAVKSKKNSACEKNSNSADERTSMRMKNDKGERR